MKFLTVLIAPILWPIAIITASNNEATALSPNVGLPHPTAVVDANASPAVNAVPVSPYYTPVADDVTLGRDSLSDDFVSAMEQFLFAQHSLTALASPPWVVVGSSSATTQTVVTFSMDDDAAKALFSFSGNVPSNKDHTYWFDRVHSLCTSDVTSLCNSGGPFVSSTPRSSNIRISLGYTYKRVEACLWNALDQRALSQPCGQAIVELCVIQTADVRTHSQAAPWTHTMSSSSSSSLPERTLSWLLQSHNLVLKILAMLLSLVLFHLALFPRRRRHGRCETQRKILRAIREDAQLFEHVQRVLGESLDLTDRAASHPADWIHGRRNVLSRIAIGMLPKTTLMAFFLFLSWTSPFFVTLFLGFHLMVILFLHMTGLCIDRCWFNNAESLSTHTPSLPWDDETSMGRSLIQPLMASDQSGENTIMRPVFVGVPLKIV